MEELLEAGAEADLSALLSCRPPCRDGSIASRMRRSPTARPSPAGGPLKRIGREQTVSVTYTYARFLLTGPDATGEPVRLPDYSSHGLEAAGPAPGGERKCG